MKNRYLVHTFKFVVALATCILCLENADGTDAVNLTLRLQGMRLACNE